MKTSQYPQPAPAEETVALPQITLLVTAGCHLCEQARVALAGRAESGELGLTVVPVDSDEGRALQARHRPVAFPLVLVDGRWFSAGRLPERRLQRVLARRRTR